MIANLTRGLAENRLEDRLKAYTVPRLLIVDEIGYLPIDRNGANLFFQLISSRQAQGRSRPGRGTGNHQLIRWGIFNAGKIGCLLTTSGKTVACRRKHKHRVIIKAEILRLGGTEVSA